MKANRRFDFLGAISIQILACFSLLLSCTTDDVEPELIDENIPQKVIFDFTSDTAIKGWGIVIPDGSAGTEISSTSQDGVSIRATHGDAKNHARIYATGSGVLDLRVYAGDVLTFEAPNGYIITAMQWTSQNTTTINEWIPSCGTIAEGVWTPPTDGTVNSVSLKATGTTRMNVLTVTYEKGVATLKPTVTPAPEPEPEDPISVSLDFTSADAIQSWGYEVPGKSSGILLDRPLVIKGFTLTPHNAKDATDKTSIRFYTSKGGATDLRIYKGDAITLSVEEGYSITSLSWTSANMDNIDSWAVDSGTISSGVWKGEDGKKCTSVTLTATGTTRINVLSMTYEK